MGAKAEKAATFWAERTRDGDSDAEAHRRIKRSLPLPQPPLTPLTRRDTPSQGTRRGVCALPPSSRASRAPQHSRNPTRYSFGFFFWQSDCVRKRSSLFSLHRAPLSWKQRAHDERHTDAPSLLLFVRAASPSINSKWPSTLETSPRASRVRASSLITPPLAKRISLLLHKRACAASQANTRQHFLEPNLA